MISLKQYWSREENQLLSVTLQAYRGTLSVIASACRRTNPRIGESIQNSLSILGARLSTVTEPTEVHEIQLQVEQKLAEFGKLSESYLQERTAEVKEIILMMTQQAESTAKRDKGHSLRLNAVTNRLNAISKLEDFGTLKQALIHSGDDLRSCVGEMETDWRNSLEKLRSQLAQYQSKLEEAEQLALVDELTGLSNRRCLERHIGTLLKCRSVFCLAVMDLNGFKQINDTYGHIVGDQLLRQLAAELLQAAASRATVGRWGGDEFLLIFDASLEEAKLRMHRICDWAIGTYRLDVGGAKLEVSIGASIGLTSWVEGDTLATLVARADEVMYAQKNLKRPQDAHPLTVRR